MPNPIKYNTSAETLALKKGNFWIGTGDVEKGPTSTTGFWNGISPPSGGFTIYLNKSSNGPSIYTVTTEAQLTGLTSTIAGQTLTTSGACLNWFATQTDKMILNKDYNNIVTNGLILNLDASFTPSYPTTGTTWYDVSLGGNNGTITNGPTFNTSGGGNLVFDGIDDFVNLGSLSIINGLSNFSFSIVFNSTQNESFIGLFGEGSGPRYTLELHNGLIRWWVGGNTIDTTQQYNDGNWHICTITQNSSGNYKCYVDGNLVLNTTQTSLSLGTENFAVASWNNLSYTYEGKIAIFQIYNRVLSATEVLQNYLATINPKFIFGSNLKIWYDMSLQESTSNVDNVNTIDLSNNLTTLSRVYDLSGNGKHLTQTTKVNQPTFIRNSQNGKPANYNTGGQWYDADATVMYMNGGLTQGARSFFIVIKGASRSAFSWDRGGATPGSLQLGYDGGNGWNDLQQDTGFTIPGGNSTTTYVMSYMFDTNQSIFYRNGNLNRTQTNNTYTLNGNSVGCWTTAPSAGNQEGYWYEMVYLNKIPTIAEYNALVTYLGTKWGVSCGTLTNYN